MSAQVVDRGTCGSKTIESHAEGNISRELLLRLREEILVGFVLELGALIHCSLFKVMHDYLVK